MRFAQMLAFDPIISRDVKSWMAHIPSVFTASVRFPGLTGISDVRELPGGRDTPVYRVSCRGHIRQRSQEGRHSSASTNFGSEVRPNDIIGRLGRLRDRGIRTEIAFLFAAPCLFAAQSSPGQFGKLAFAYRGRYNLATRQNNWHGCFGVRYQINRFAVATRCLK